MLAIEKLEINEEVILGGGAKLRLIFWIGALVPFIDRGWRQG